MSLSQSNNLGQLISVYYLKSSERAAAELFAEISAEVSEQVDLDERNVLQTGLPREMYDPTLNASGQHGITRCPTVVTEEREDGTLWVIDRDRYDTQVDRRYAIKETGATRVPAEASPESLFAELGPVITESNLAATAVQGDVRQIPDYVRATSVSDCVPTSTDGNQLAVKKCL